MKTSANETSISSLNVNPSSGATICKFFNRANGCRFGEKCRYRHELESAQQRENDVEIQPVSEGGEIPGNSEIADHFGTHPEGLVDSEKVKGALAGSRGHKQDGANAMPKKKRQIRQPVCRYFKKSGFCRDGNKCRFLHQINVTKSKSLINAHMESSGQILPVENQIKPNTLVCDKLNISEQQSHMTKPTKRPENLSEKLSELTDDGAKYLQAIEIEQLKKRFGNDLNITQEDHGTVYMLTIKPTDPDWPYDINEVQLNVTFPNNYPKEIFEAEVIDDDGQFPANFTKYVNSDIEKHLKEHGEAQKLRDSTDLLFRPFLRWLDRNLEILFTKALKQIKFEIEAQSAGLEFITFEDSSNKTNDGHKKSETQIYDTSNLEDKEDVKLGVEKISTELGVIQIGGDGGDDDGGDVGGEDGGKGVGDEDGDNEKKVPGKEDASAMFDMIETRKSGNFKKGTEIRFRGMELHENTATVRATSLTFTIQCGRCKNREEMPNVKENTQVVLVCSKCSNAASITFTSSEIVHQHSTTLAYINPQGCLPIDLILSESQMVLGCLHCNKETSIKGINYGSTKNVWCHHCHNKLDLKIEAARFHQLQPAKESEGKIKTVELKKLNTKTKDPAIKSGQTLPDNGTCKHYKKSFRWMRFPCCGKCYPCDKCHEEAGDGHEMEQATRMICGFCSKEQAFSQKGCVSCKASMTAVRTSHWEGGKGCRNKMKMNRGDDKKYSDKNKTVSRHAIKVEGQKKK